MPAGVPVWQQGSGPVMTVTRILVTGGAGFVGSHYVRALLGPGGPSDVAVTVLDALTHAA